MKQARQYPPDWLSDEDAAYLLGIGASTFRSYVQRGLLPQGALLGSSRRWSRKAINEAMEVLAGSPVEENSATGRYPVAGSPDGEVDPVLGRMKEYLAGVRAANGGRLSKSSPRRRRGQPTETGLG